MVKRSVPVVLSAFAMALAAQATETSYEWDPSARTTQFGIATIGYSESADTVTNITMNGDHAAPETVVFTGGNDFEFAENAALVMNGGNLRFETPVTGGGIKLTRGDDLVAYDGWLYKNSPVLAFPGMHVAEIEFEKAWLQSHAIPSTVVTDFRNVVRTETSLSAEFQVKDSSLAKGLRVTLEDGEGGIYAYANYARYANAQPYEISFDDLDAVTAKGGRDVAVVQDATSTSGYGVCSVTVRRLYADSCYTMSVPNTTYSVAAASVGAGTALELDSLAEGSAISNLTLRGSGHVVVRDMENAEIVGDFSSSRGILSFVNSQAEDESRNAFSTNIAVSSTFKAQKELLSEGLLLDEIVGWSVPSMVNSVSAPTTPVICFVVTNEAEHTIQFQMQSADGYGKGSAIEFSEANGNVYMRKLLSAYWNLSDAPVGTVDILNPHISLKDSWVDTANYNPSAFNLECETDVHKTATRVAVSMADTTRKLILHGAKISDVKRIVGIDHLVGNMSDTTKAPVYCFESRTEDSIEFQLQIYDGGRTKGSKYRLYQVGNDIYGYKVISWYTDSRNWVGTKSFDDYDPSEYVGTATGGSYYLEGMTIIYHWRLSMTAAIPAIKRESATGLTIDIGANVALAVGGDKQGNGPCLPQGGVVNVAGSLSVTNRYSYGSGEVNVFAGGKVLLTGDNAVAHDTNLKFTLDGGVLVSGDSLSYVNKLTFRNGATATPNASDSKIRVGVRNLTWAVDGSSSSECNTPLLCASGGQGAGEFTMTWDVADVTGDAGVDFWMNAGMTEHPDGVAGGVVTPNGGMIHKKAGAGTLRWGGQSTCTGIVQVAEGTLLLGVNDALNPGTSSTERLRAKQPVQLMGGTLAAEAFTTNSVQRLSVSTETSAIVLGEGASLSVDAFDGFGEGARLCVTLGEGATLHFDTALTAAALRNIRVNGNNRALQDENGDIVSGGIPGVMIYIR